MSRAPVGSSRWRTVAVLVPCSLIGWGTTFEMPAVSGRLIAADLGISNEISMLGLTVMLLVGALIGPAVGRVITRHGASRVLATASLFFACGLALLSQAVGAVSLLSAWVVIGVGGGMALSIGTNTAVVEREGVAARRTIAMMMLFTGLSSTVFWPILSMLDAAIGWRATCLVTAGLHLLVCLPLHLFALPKPNPVHLAAAVGAAPTPPLRLEGAARRRAMIAVATVLTVFGFVTFGLSPVLIEVLKRSGASADLALTLGAMRSVLGTGARGVDFALGRLATPLLTASVGAGVMVAGFLMFFVATGSVSVPILFVVAYGFGSGVATVARVVLPLQFFAPAEYAMISGRLAVPQNLANAVAPVVFTAVLDRGGVAMVAVLSIVSLAVALAALASLARSSAPGRVLTPNCPAEG